LDFVSVTHFYVYNFVIKAFPTRKRKSDNDILTMICMFTVNFANQKDEDI